MNYGYKKTFSGRWGKVEKENASVNRFPAELTEQQLCCCETLGPRFQGPSALKKGPTFRLNLFNVFNAEDGT